jgi:capsular exopolysaccharide synthesis family protein
MMLGYEGVGVDYVHLPPEQPELHKQDSLKVYFNVLRRRKWYVIIPMLLVVPLLIANAVLEEPFYQASARVLIEPANPQVININTLLRPVLSEEDLLTEYQLIRSEEHLAEVVDRLDLQDKLVEKNDLISRLQRLKGELTGVVKRLKSRALALVGITLEPAVPTALVEGIDLQRLAAIKALRESLLVEPQEGGKLVNITVKGLEPAEVAMQANTVAEVYIDKNFEKKQAGTQAAIEKLIDQTAELRQKMYDAESEIHQFRLDQGITSYAPKERGEAITLMMNRLENEYQDARRAREEVEGRLRNIQSLANSDVRALKTVPNSLDAHMIDSIMRLRGQYLDLEAQISTNRRTYRPKHPVMARLNTQLAQTRDAIDAEFQKGIAALQAEFNIRRQRESDLLQQLTEQKRETQGANDALSDFERKQHEAESYRDLYRQTSERLRVLQMDEATIINNVKLIQRAQAPLEPVPSGAFMQFFAVVALAGCLGVGVAFVREYLDNRFKEADEVEAFLQLPFLGVVPHYPQGKGRTYEPVLLREPGSVAAESYRILRTRLQSAAPRMETLLVTSALPSEGKSTTTANMGIAFARLGLRVLLVDIDFRRPSLHRHFWISNSEGLATALFDGGDWQNYLQDTPVASLKILPTGFNTYSPSDLLSLRSTQKLIDEFKQSFDFIIFDGPIILSIPDVEIVAPWMDGVVMVHYPERCDKPSVLNAKMLLERVNSTVLGIVFNNIRRQDQKYYHQQRTYYSQNLYSGAEQYDLDWESVRELQVADTETAKHPTVFANEAPDAVEAPDCDPSYGDEPVDGLGIHLHRVIINHTINGEPADPDGMFLILDLELRHTSPTRSTVIFDPQSAIIRLHQTNGSKPEPIRCDAVTKQMQRGFKGEVELSEQETKRGVMAFRIPAGISACQFEYDRYRTDVTLDF